MWYWHKNFDSDVSLEGKTVAITGANTGIGKETAKNLYKRGARVLILCRNVEKSKLAMEEIKADLNPRLKANNHDIIYKKLDLSNFSSIRECAQKIIDEEINLHLLINNAGLLCSPKSSGEYDVHLRVNYLGHFLLTMLLLPKMMKSGSARVINVGSNSHNCPLFNGALDFKNFHTSKSYLGQVQNYCQSKTAQMLFSKELARRLQDAGIDNVTVVSCHPGYANSEFFRNLDYVFMGVHWVYKTFVARWLLTPKQAADTVEYCAVEPNLQSGKYYSFCAPREPNRFIENKKIAKELWEESLKLLNMQDFDLTAVA